MEIIEAWHYESPEGTNGEGAALVKLEMPGLWDGHQVQYQSSVCLRWQELERWTTQVFGAQKIMLVTELHTLDFGFF